MKSQRFRPKLDTMFYIIALPTFALVLGFTVFPALQSVTTLFWTVPIGLFCLYFIVSPLFGYVELRESTVYIRYGCLLKREIPYERIRSVEEGRGVISESMLSLKNALEHVNIKYNTFDVTTVSVVDNGVFVQALKERLSGA